ncbi:MAG: SDR family oxidoreductase [Selenomonadaceae bacterium]|nr:SDR family oxidoreductase [Selenomonadaceae bacterium]
MSTVMYDFTGERYVVTGASSGMGRQVTLELAQAGAEVLAIGRNEARLATVKAEAPERIFPASLDVCDSAALEAAVAAFVQEHGKLNGGVHAAGYNEFTPLKANDVATAHRIMDTSFWAGLDLLRLVTKAKYGVKGTSTVFFSSVSAAAPVGGKIHYSAAKAALNAALRAAAKEICGRGHRVNSVMPGWVRTSMTQQAESDGTNMDLFTQRELLGFGQPSDVSGMVLYLLSDRAHWMTGAAIPVDGGYLA